MLPTATIEAEFLQRRDVERRVREYMRDYAELNTLFDGREHSSVMILHVIDLVIEEVNMWPPPVGLLLALAIPLPLLIDGAVARLLESVSILDIRNDMEFTVDDLTVRLDQYQVNLQLAARKRQDFLIAMKTWKTALNAQQAVDEIGGIYSDWVWVNLPSRRYLASTINSIPSLLP